MSQINSPDLYIRGIYTFLKWVRINLEEQECLNYANFILLKEIIMSLIHSVYSLFKMSLIQGLLGLIT